MSVPNPLFSNTNVLKLMFKHTEHTYGLLYDITYIASDKGRGCGGEVFNYAGVFTSPGYPNTDRNDSDCTWVINVPQTLKVALKFDGKFSNDVSLCSEPLIYLTIFQLQFSTWAQDGCATITFWRLSNRTANKHRESSVVPTK